MSLEALFQETRRIPEGGGGGGIRGVTHFEKCEDMVDQSIGSRQIYTWRVQDLSGQHVQRF